MAEVTTERFDPRKHLLNLKGKSYLPVAARIVAFREVCPISEGWSIRTQRLEGGRSDKYALYKATITDPEGRIVAEGTKQEDVAGFPDFEEKAETGSIGRALATAGYGTLYALEFDEGADVCDGPVTPAAKATPRPTPAAASAVAPQPTPRSAPKPASGGAPPVCPVCKDADKLIPPGRVSFCAAKGQAPTHFECGDVKLGGEAE